MDQNLQNKYFLCVYYGSTNCSFFQSYADEGHDLRGVLEHVYRSMEDFLTECLSLDTDEAKVTQDTWELPPFITRIIIITTPRPSRSSTITLTTTGGRKTATSRSRPRDDRCLQVIIGVNGKVLKNVRFVIINHNRVIYIIVQISELRV